MCQDVEFDLKTIDYRTLTATQLVRLVDDMRRHASRERSAAMRALVRALFEGAGRRLGRARQWAGRQRQAYREWRRRRMAAAELNALDDRTLWDIGVRRCEIPSVVIRHDSSRAR